MSKIDILLLLAGVSMIGVALANTQWEGQPKKVVPGEAASEISFQAGLPVDRLRELNVALVNKADAFERLNVALDKELAAHRALEQQLRARIQLLGDSARTGMQWNGAPGFVPGGATSTDGGMTWCPDPSGMSKETGALPLADLNRRTEQK